MGDSPAPDSHDQALRVRPAFRPSIRFRRGASWQGTGPGARRWGSGRTLRGAEASPEEDSEKFGRGGLREAPSGSRLGVFWPSVGVHVAVSGSPAGSTAPAPTAQACVPRLLRDDFSRGEESADRSTEGRDPIAAALGRLGSRRRESNPRPKPARPEGRIFVCAFATSGTTRSRRRGPAGLPRPPSLRCATPRVSLSRVHAHAYGLLGIAVDRRFVLDRWGSPVHYVRNSSDERVVGTFIRARYLVGRLRTLGLLARLSSFGYFPDADDLPEYVDYLGTFLKAMSEKNRNNYRYIDEHEWRVVANQEQVLAGKMTPRRRRRPRHRLRLAPGDVRVVVFPDARTRGLAVKNSSIKKFILKSGFGMQLLTIDECEQF
jgi:hypothetical protein